jgi:hypothetical protein
LPTVDFPGPRRPARLNSCVVKPSIRLVIYAIEPSRKYSIRLLILMAVAAILGLRIYEIVVVLAYLISELNDKIYLVISKGIDILDKKKRLYSLTKPFADLNYLTHLVLQI